MEPTPTTVRARLDSAYRFVALEDGAEDAWARQQWAVGLDFLGWLKAHDWVPVDRTKGLTGLCFWEGHPLAVNSTRDADGYAVVLCPLAPHIMASLLSSQAPVRVSTRALAKILHEVNNYHMAISGQLDLLQRGLQGDTVVTRRVQQVWSALASGRQLARDLRSWSGNRVYAFQLIHKAELWAELETASTPESPVLFEDQCGGREVAVRGDLAALVEVFERVVENARLASSGRGTVECRASVLDGAAGEPVLQLAVTDMGQGMDEEQLARAFVFFESGWESKRRGVGLAVARAIVKAHNGFIGVESRSASGTRVTIRIPLWQIGQQDVSESMNKAALVVSQDTHFMEGVSRQLEGLGWKVYGARFTGAAKVLAKGLPEALQLVVMDVGSEVEDARTVLHEIASGHLRVRGLVVSKENRSMQEEGLPNEGRLVFVSSGDDIVGALEGKGSLDLGKDKGDETDGSS